MKVCVYLLTCIYDMGLSLQNFRTSSEIKRLYRRREDVNAIRQICINLLPCLCVCADIVWREKNIFEKKYIGYEMNKRTDLLEPNKIKSGYYNNWAAIDWLLSGIFFVFLFLWLIFSYLFFVVAVLFERRNLFYYICAQNYVHNVS